MRYLIVMCMLALCCLVGAEEAEILFSKKYENPEPNPNLALGAEAAESSFMKPEKDDMTGARLCDGMFSRYGYWMPDPKAEQPHWARIDLGTPKNFRAFRIYFMPGVRGNPDSCPAFAILAGDAPDALKVIYEADADAAPKVTNPNIYAGRTIDCNPVTARYIQFQLKEKIGDFVLHEIEVFDEIPAPRTLRHEPGDPRIRMREVQRPDNLVRDGDLTVWVASATEKVFRDEVLAEGLPMTPGKPVEVEAARGETESFQVVMHSPSAVDSASVSLASHKGGKSIPSDWVRVHPIGYVFIRIASENLRINMQGVQHPGQMFGPGFYPEVLLSNKTYDLLAGKHQPFWVRIEVPRDAEAGVYESVCAAKAGGVTMEIPLRLTVRDITLPPLKEREIVNVQTFNIWAARQEEKNLSDEAYRKLWKSKRQVASRVGRTAFSSITPPNVTREEQDNLTYDWEPFDKEVEWFLANTDVRDFMLPWDYQSYHGWINPNEEVIGPGVEPGSDRWLALLRQALILHRDHLREKGWLDNFWFFVYDEPDNSLNDLMIRLVKMAREAAPELPRILHSHAWEEDLIPLEETYVVNPRRYHIPFHDEMQERGWKLWTYCNGASIIDGPPNSARFIPYAYFKHGITGMTWHSMDDWTDEGPWQAPNRYATWNCSSCFIFPDPEDETRALSTVRLEMWRDGQEDYELLKMLEAHADKPEAAAILQKAKDTSKMYGFDDPLSREDLYKMLVRPWHARPEDAPFIMATIKYDDDPNLAVEIHDEACELLEELQ